MNEKTIRLFRQLQGLDEAKTLVMKPIGIFRKRYDAKAVVDVTNAYEEKRHELWAEIYSIHPEAKKGTWEYTCKENEAFIQSND